ncbi:hypothetical protein Ddye_025677 [Dipteronia dyeriana]|uniref:Pectinesterase inhibitor domain-containing protein n=1 Tax=Dipteronia dyeriana TaxID=168575 RepID=A0AAD9TKP8_9ROSI|nr:hypothetical protein Ddye_025677 [Dipteronia dyeriana]
MNMVGSSLPLFVFSIAIHFLLIVNQDSALATDLINKSCSGTKVPNICVSTLEADPRSKATTNLQSLSRIAIDIISEKINETVSPFTKTEKNVTDPHLKKNIEACIKVFHEIYRIIKFPGIPNFETGDYKDVKQDLHWCAIAASECQDKGTKLFSKEVETLSNFSLDMMNFMDMLSS